MKCLSIAVKFRSSIGVDGHGDGGSGRFVSLVFQVPGRRQMVLTINGKRHEVTVEKMAG